MLEIKPVPFAVSHPNKRGAEENFPTALVLEMNSLQPEEGLDMENSQRSNLSRVRLNSKTNFLGQSRELTFTHYFIDTSLFIILVFIITTFTEFYIIFSFSIIIIIFFNKVYIKYQRI